MNIKKWVVVFAALFSMGIVHARLVFTKIDNPGFYQLSDELFNSVTIEVSDVTFDLNGHTITAADGIIINSGLDTICVKNGNIQATNDGVIVNSGCTGITLENMRIEGAIRGINFDNVTGSMIKNCEMSMNTTGLELDNSHNITIDSTIVNCSTHAGFELISSTTCLLENCKALSTGQSNNDLFDTMVFGFVSNNGYGNVFERCIANATQALSTTDSNSLIAGFALRGSESCTKIFDSESANTQTNVTGFTVPYGILLEGTLDSTMSVTGYDIQSTTNFGKFIDWSFDGKFIAVGSRAGGAMFGLPALQVYQFNGIEKSIRLFDSIIEGSIIPTALNATFNSVDWSPSGQYIAAVGTGIVIALLDPLREVLTPVAIEIDFPDTFNSVSWSPDGNYIAVGGDNLLIFSFDRVAQSLSFVTSALDSSTDVFAVDWSSDGKHIVVGGSALTGGTGDELQVFEFNRDANLLQSIAGALGTAGEVFAVNWSSDGKYVVAGGGGLTGGTGDELQVFEFDPNAQSLTAIAGALGTAGDVFAVNWSSDGKYVVAGGGGLTGGTGDEVQFLKFDPSFQTLTPEVGALGTAGEVYTVSWAPDGQYVALIGDNITGNDLQVFSALQFPEKNVIKGNTVYCNSGAQFPSGVGISGSSIANMIIRNTCYSNPIPRGANEPIVGSNYKFVTNVFNQLFGQIPSDIQNISLDGCKPICTPEDIALLVKQTLFKVEALGCGSTSLTSSDIVSGTITLASSGNYCLSTDLTADITITATCVSLDLNDRCLTGIIDATAVDDVIIKNGFVMPRSPTGAPSAAITIPSTTNDARIENVTIICADTVVNNVSGRDGIEVHGNNIQIFDCTIRSGSATATTGNAGGTGILVGSDALKVVIEDCMIETGNGAASSSVNGGDGGVGISIEGDATQTEIYNTTILSTGNGGDATGGGNGGNGGHGMFVASTAIDTSIRNCTIRNTGSGGSGTVAGAPGKAIDDDVTTVANLSQIFSNFAHNIANSTKFDLQAAGETGILTPNPPTATVINPLANVYSS